MKNQKYLVTIIGPTGIGKTTTSIALAKEFQSEIISADSRQFYKEMQIGTAVPNEKELTEVPHHFIQHISINQDYNVGDFESDALQLLKEKFKNRDILFMVGGSGLYIDAVLKGLDTFPKVNSQVRLDLQKLFLESGIEALQEKLQLLDPEYYEKVDKNNVHRLIRALEICIGTNKPYSSFLGKNNAGRNFTPIKIGLSAEREIIYNRINNRVNLMIENGLMNEVKNLNNKKHLNALQTVGYTEMFTHLEGVITFEKAVEEIKKNSRRYAKRQLSWWRKDESIKWFEYDDKIENIINYIKLKTS